MRKSTKLWLVAMAGLLVLLVFRTLTAPLPWEQPLEDRTYTQYDADLLQKLKIIGRWDPSAGVVHVYPRHWYRFNLDEKTRLLDIMSRCRLEAVGQFPVTAVDFINGRSLATFTPGSGLILL